MTSKMVLPEKMCSIAVDKQGQYAACGTMNGRVYLWEVGAPQRVRSTLSEQLLDSFRNPVQLLGGSLPEDHLPPLHRRRRCVS
jgi:hypothetical protein